MMPEVGNLMIVGYLSCKVLVLYACEVYNCVP